MSHFVTLLKWSTEGLLAFWPLSAPIVCVIVIGLLRGLRSKDACPAGIWWWGVLPFLLPAVPLAVGAALWRMPGSNTPLPPSPHWASAVFYVAIAVQYLAAGFVVYRAWNSAWRVFGIGAAAAQMLWMIVVEFLAGMAVSGDWL
jgi:hypothetical protein